MWDWVLIGVLYVFCAAFLRLLGGFGAAGEALQAWGRASAARRMKRSSPTSS